MKLGILWVLLTAMLAGVAIVGPGFYRIQSTLSQTPDAAVENHFISRSVIKVHTDHGVITLPGSADSWEEVENASFVADSIADVQIANNEVPWRISYE